MLKYAPLYSPAHILSTGLVITAPTGGFATSVVVKEDRIEEVHPVQLQPYVGYLWQKDDFYLHGFASIMVPTDSDDVTVPSSTWGWATGCSAAEASSRASCRRWKFMRTSR